MLTDDYQIPLRGFTDGLAEACHNFSRAPHPNGIVAKHISIRVLNGHSPDFQPAKNFISKAYELEFGASIEVNYPTLISVYDGCGKILAAVGLRRAGDEPLFLEQYIKQPLESALFPFAPHDINRKAIAELGSFATSRSSASIYLMGATAAYLVMQKVEYASVTATDKLVRLFGLFNFDIRVICPAQKSALHCNDVDWGSYYDCNPQVAIGSVQQCLCSIMQCYIVRNSPARSATLNRVIRQIWSEI